MADAPPASIASQIRGIVGLQITIGALDGKWKVSQNRSVEDRLGVADWLKDWPGPGNPRWRSWSETSSPAVDRMPDVECRMPNAVWFVPTGEPLTAGRRPCRRVDRHGPTLMKLSTA